MRSALIDLLHIDLKEYEDLSMRLYRVPPAVRGRHIGDFVILGWYTHRDNKRIDALDPASVEVWGHDNAVIVGRDSEADVAKFSRAGSPESLSASGDIAQPWTKSPLQDSSACQTDLLSSA